MRDAPTIVSKTLFYAEALAAVLNLASSARRRGLPRAAALFALATGAPAFGEVLVTGPLGLLRHRTKPRLFGVPVAILLFWYNTVCGVHAATERVLARTSLSAVQRQEALPVATALTATSLDLVLDPFGLDAGLWQWKVNGAYAPEVFGANGRQGVPALNYLGWMVVVTGIMLGYIRLFPESRPGGRLPVLLLLPSYLVSAGWAIQRRRPIYLLYSALFPLVAYLGSKEER